MTKHWTFEDSNLANNFGDHVRGQLPWYDLATGLVRCIAENYLTRDGVMYDIGCSTGNITKSCSDLIESRGVEAISIEPSSEMCQKWNGVGQLLNIPAEECEFKEYDLAVCFLTLMFINPRKREKLINDLLKSMSPHGVLVIVDKFQGKGGYFETVKRRMVMRQKISCGESPQDILDKELSLSGVQRPLGDELPENECFFQAGEFKGIVITGAGK